MAGSALFGTAGPMKRRTSATTAAIDLGVSQPAPRPSASGTSSLTQRASSSSSATQVRSRQTQTSGRPDRVRREGLVDAGQLTGARAPIAHERTAHSARFRIVMTIDEATGSDLAASLDSTPGVPDKAPNDAHGKLSSGGLWQQAKEFRLRHVRPRSEQGSGFRPRDLRLPIALCRKGAGIASAVPLGVDRGAVPRLGSTARWRAVTTAPGACGWLPRCGSWGGKSCGCPRSRTGGH